MVPTSTMQIKTQVQEQEMENCPFFWRWLALAFVLASRVNIDNKITHIAKQKPQHEKDHYTVHHLGKRPQLRLHVIHCMFFVCILGANATFAVTFALPSEPGFRLMWRIRRWSYNVS